MWVERMKTETGRIEKFNFEVDLLSVWFVRRLLCDMQARHPVLAYSETKTGWTVFEFNLSGDANSVAAARRAVDHFYLNRLSDYPIP